MHLQKMQGKLSDRMNYIVKTIFRTCGGKLEWWDWKNDDPNYRSEIVQPDINEFYGFIKYYSVGSLKNDMIIAKDGQEMIIRDEVPIRWLWEDFEEELTNGLAEKKRREELRKEHGEQKALEKKEKNKELRKQAMSKLSPEEMSALGVKKWQK